MFVRRKRLLIERTAWAKRRSLGRPGTGDCHMVPCGGPAGIRVGSPALPRGSGFWPKENHWGQVALLLCETPEGTKGQLINISNESYINDCLLRSLSQSTEAGGILHILSCGIGFHFSKLPPSTVTNDNPSSC